MLRLVKRGRTYYLRGAVRGIAVYESTKVADREVAETVRIKREAELLDRSLHGAKAVATFVEAAVTYMEAGGERRFLSRLVDHFKGARLADIDQGAIDGAARALYPGAGNATLNRQVYTPMSAVLKHASRRGLVEHRPVGRPRQPRGKLNWMTADEADRLIAACSPHMVPLVTFLLYTGARMGEALGLDWRNVELPRRHVLLTDTKNGESRGVPLHSRAFAALANLGHRDGKVFRRPDGEEYVEKVDGGGQVKTAFRGACIRAGLYHVVVKKLEDGTKVEKKGARFTPHDCRHTWATWHYASNRNLKALMELGGWKSEAMVMRYVHVNADHLRASIDALPGGAESVQSAQTGG